MKICNKCKIEKDGSQFYKHVSNRDRLGSSCKKCLALYVKTPERKEAAAKYEQTPERKITQAKSNAKYLKTPEGKETRANYEQTPEYKLAHRKSEIKYRYGITLEEYNDLLTSQNGGCAICKTKTPGGNGDHFHIDHDHVTGKIRGLLCHACNIGQGYFKDDPSLLIASANYLIKHRQIQDAQK